MEGLGIIRLGEAHRSAVRARLLRAPLLHLHLLRLLEAHPLELLGWYGLAEGADVEALVLVAPALFAVPGGAPIPAAERLGAHLRALYRRCRISGPRDACDALWREWAPGVAPAHAVRQQMMVLREPPAEFPCMGLRRARRSEWRAVGENLSRMWREEHGQSLDVAQVWVEEKLRLGHTWVLEREGQLVFQADVSLRTRWGCQVEGVYTSPEHRSRGYATAGVSALARRLLRKSSAVTLVVNEDNAAALRLYARCGFTPLAAWRNITP
ncbi:GNAT family N-acetyltransferase [Corallococcus exiguus]|uniref:GNAT family N-acetyltransferase n=1 Tax=Corallococcus TaxID=83461 RepID=UPI000EA10809|nr:MULTISPECIES: GNAT family N-acetyltransferase [Corallococcus]NNB96223.1 GNAT family N-acetyltransferase [Corallococcus exiguus]RKH31186.1 GNAT family N-acetyltransferase [Corallococcus sp. CA041A]